MNSIIKKLEKKIIISCQASKGEPFHDVNCLMAMVKSVINGGASGLRLAGERDIKEAKKFCEVPVIGITKPEPLPENWKEVVYITPTFEDAKKIKEADIIAIDGTSRPRPQENLAELIYNIQTELNTPVMVDISTLEEGLMCKLFGADIISTTLSGYTMQTLDKNNEEPDFELLKNLVKIAECPVILEGRVWTPEHVKKAFNLGAYAVVIGSAVTRPHLITERFIKAVQ
ncbi:MAG: N-acetylmannosamine-6-phosphate 2-epimerase [Candidatus Gastranaerophilales bacterium]|nr:N-acetylmannosamine-6-phosphate 2-epimerase [Candidatus Gastranaerophilales bacterium]